MRILAFDTSTEVLSVAVGAPVHGERRTWARSGSGGAQASHTLIATVQDLLRQAGLQLKDLDAIGFGAGPGAFTGLRTACAVARAWPWVPGCGCCRCHPCWHWRKRRVSTSTAQPVDRL